MILLIVSFRKQRSWFLIRGGKFVDGEMLFKFVEEFKNIKLKFRLYMENI